MILLKIFQNALIFDWIKTQLSSKSITLKMKNRLLDLLSPFVDVDDETTPTLATLRKMSALNFPLTSRELTVGSSDYSDYVLTFEKLSACLEETASAQVLVKFWRPWRCLCSSVASIGFVSRSFVGESINNISKSNTFRFMYKLQMG